MSPTRKNRNGEGRILGVGLLNIAYSSLLFFSPQFLAGNDFRSARNCISPTQNNSWTIFGGRWCNFRLLSLALEQARCWQICFYPHSRERSRGSSTLDQHHAERTNKRHLHDADSARIGRHQLKGICKSTATKDEKRLPRGFLAFRRSSCDGVAKPQGPFRFWIRIQQSLPALAGSFVNTN